jgi:hypothetical protein
MENNLEKEFVTYEQAKSLKGLKFDEPCFGYYEDVELPNPFLVITKISDTQGGYFTFAPLKQQVFRWFREKYGLQAYLTTFLEMCRNDGDTYHVVVGGSWYPQLDSIDYEKAENAAIDKLIERAKQQNNGKI